MWTHVTQPLTSDGAAVNVVIREVSRAAAEAGIATLVVAGDKRDLGFPVADILPVDFSPYISREHRLYPLSFPERIIDSIRGQVGLSRRNVARLYAAVAHALPRSGGPIFVHDGYLGAAGLVTLRQACPDRPLYLWMHNELSPAYSPREVRTFLSLAERVFCVSDSLSESVRRAARSDTVARRVVTVLNGVDPGRFSPAGARSSQRPARILFVGRMIKAKGPDVLVAALSQLHAAGVDFQATFLGASNPDAADDRSLVRRIRHAMGSFADQVSFEDFRPHAELPDVYRDHDILVVPSRFEEPFSLTLLEGMASGLAAVAARRGGMPQVAGDAARYFEEDSDLVVALRTLIENPELRTDLGRRARLRAEQLNWSRTFEEVRGLVGLAT